MNKRNDVGGIKIPLAIIEDKLNEEYYVMPEVDMTINLKQMVLMFFPADEHDKRGVLIMKPRKASVSAMFKDLDRIEHSSSDEKDERGTSLSAGALQGGSNDRSS